MTWTPIGGTDADLEAAALHLWVLGVRPFPPWARAANLRLLARGLLRRDKFSDALVWTGAASDEADRLAGRAPGDPMPGIGNCACGICLSAQNSSAGAPSRTSMLGAAHDLEGGRAHEREGVAAAL